MGRLRLLPTSAQPACGRQSGSRPVCWNDAVTRRRPPRGARHWAVHRRRDCLVGVCRAYAVSRWQRGPCDCANRDHHQRHQINPRNQALLAARRRTDDGPPRRPHAWCAQSGADGTRCAGLHTRHAQLRTMSAFRTKSVQCGNDPDPNPLSSGGQAQSRSRFAIAGRARGMDPDRPRHRASAPQPNRSFWRIVGIAKWCHPRQRLRHVALGPRR